MISRPATALACCLLLLGLSPTLGAGASGTPTVFVSPAGSDGGKCTKTSPCATFDRAYHVARPGDVVSVAPGEYALTDPAFGAHTIYPDPAKAAATQPVTFVCGGSGPVTFAAPQLFVFPGTRQVAVKGGCFHVHVLSVGAGGYAELTQDVTFDGVHMESFALYGADRVTIASSEIGPAVNCYGPGRTGTGDNGGPITPAMWCDPAKPSEAYWATVPNGNSDQQMEPTVRESQRGGSTNVKLVGNWIHDVQTKDAFNLHTGGLLIQQASGGGILIRGNRFERDAIYDIEADPTPPNVTILDNWFGAPVEAFSSGKGGNAEVARAEVENVLRSGGQLCFSSWTVRSNSFAHGYAPDESLTPGSCWSNVRVVGNIMGRWGCAAGKPGISYEANLVFGGKCGETSAGVPYGYLLERSRLVADKRRAEAVRTIFGSFVEGTKPAAIARSLRRSRTPAPRGGWRATTVRAILADRSYLGRAWGPPGAHPALVRYPTWRAAQRLLAAAR